MIDQTYDKSKEKVKEALPEKFEALRRKKTLKDLRTSPKKMVQDVLATLKLQTSKGGQRTELLKKNVGNISDYTDNKFLRRDSVNPLKDVSF